MDDATAARRMARKHIFCVNGDPVFLDLLRELFQDANYNVTTTNFVPRTFEQIAALGPDLLVVDLVIGERAGFDLLEQLTESAVTQGIPVIAVSTTQSLIDYAQENANRFGSNRYQVKPLDIEQLLEAVNEMLLEDD